LRPVIGITCVTRHTTPVYAWQTSLTQDSQNRDYVRCIMQAGGVPVLLPCALDEESTRAALERLDGVIISGGGDMAPSYYDEDPHEKLGTVDPLRDALDTAAVTGALEREDLPVLGICRGIQSINVACGGTLYQDLSLREDTSLQHRQQAPREHASHEAELEPDSQLREILGAPKVGVNSFHHQAVRDLAPDFIVSARTSDGLIEGIELPSHPFCVAVQWHPEHMTEHHPHAQRLFHALVEAARNRG
jgi:putative glutamine amidotransferase